MQKSMKPVSPKPKTRKIVARLVDVSAETHTKIQEEFKLISRVLKEDGIDHDGVLISVDTGKAYAFKQIEEIKEAVSPEKGSA